MTTSQANTGREAWKAYHRAMRHAARLSRAVAYQALQEVIFHGMVIMRAYPDGRTEVVPRSEWAVVGLDLSNIEDRIIAADLASGPDETVHTYGGPTGGPWGFSENIPPIEKKIPKHVQPWPNHAWDSKRYRK